MRSIKFLLVATALALSFYATTGSAQSSIRLNWQAGNPCVFTTDASGITVDPTTGALSATGTFASTDCPSGGGSTPPVITNPLAGDVPTTVSPNTQVNLSWAADAATCSYDGSSFPSGVSFGASWPTSGNACSGSSCATTHSTSLTLSAEGTYTFNISCTRAGQTISTTATTTVTTVPQTCPGVFPQGTAPLPTRQSVGTTRWDAGPVQKTSQDHTQFQSIWGTSWNGASPITKTWPGFQGIAAEPFVNKNQFVAFQFTVPSNVNPNISGFLNNTDTGTTSGSTWAMTISETCGDFTVPLTTRCADDNVTSTGGSGRISWSVNNTPNTCKLQPGHTYFLNLITATLSNPGASMCTHTSCSLDLVNQGANFP